MNICVFGLWHLGSVTAACLASVKKFRVTGLDFNKTTVDCLNHGRPPIFEEGLERLVKRGLGSGRLAFTLDPAAALRLADFVWVTFDTPVDERDHADPDWVTGQVRRIFPYLKKGTYVLVSSQLPVGTTARLESAYRKAHAHKPAHFCYLPENLRLGQSVRNFINPERIVAGVRSAADRKRLLPVLAPFSKRIIWMSVESAEMTKHAINAFLGMSVTFINEIASICEQVGADAQEVELGLKSDARIGQQSYVHPGAAFAGGTLARDIVFLKELARKRGVHSSLLGNVLASNELHRRWVHHKLTKALGRLAGRKIFLAGLAAKAGSDILRRSQSVILARQLNAGKAQVWGHDPLVQLLPRDLAAVLKLVPSFRTGLRGADALVILKKDGAMRKVTAAQLVKSMARPVVIDPNRLMESEFGEDRRVRYFAVGKPA